jgi:hypothetical protein
MPWRAQQSTKEPSGRWFFHIKIDSGSKMTGNSQNYPKKESRPKVRSLASGDASISFRPPGGQWEYQIKLRDFSDSGLGLLVRENSDLLNHIRVGDIFAVNYHQGTAAMTASNLRVQVRHISFPATGVPEKHVIVGLCFLERHGEK